MYARNSHSYTHLILALGIVREPTVWILITSKYPGIHDIGLPTYTWPQFISEFSTASAAARSSSQSANTTMGSLPVCARRHLTASVYEPLVLNNYNVHGPVAIVPFICPALLQGVEMAKAKGTLYIH